MNPPASSRGCGKRLGLAASISRFAFLVVALSVGYSGAARATWQTGDFITYVQSAWGTGSAAPILTSNFYSVYASASDLFVIGDTSKYSIGFDSPSAVEAYLPQTGVPGVLTASLLDPTVSAAGSFGGNVAALKLLVDFSDAGLLAANSGLKFGDLTIFGLTSDTDLNGQTVRQFLGIANTALGGGTHTDSIPDLDFLATNIDSSFAGGQPQMFAQDHLMAPTTSVPEPATLALLGLGLFGLTVARRRLH